MSTTDQNVLLANRIVDAVNRNDLAVLDEITHPNAADHSVPPEMPPTRDAAKRLYSSLHSAFPDLTYKIEFSVSEGDRVAQRLIGSGTMRGSFMGFPSTGKKATWTETHITRFENGKLVEHWANIDRAGMMQQLGMM